MGSQYSHLCLHERQLMFKWHHYDKLSQREIGRRLGRSHSSISRELKRNCSSHYVPTWYPHPADTAYRVRIRDRARRPLLKNEATRAYVVDKLQQGWTPEIIAGRLKQEGNHAYVCHETIYQYIYKEAKELIAYLPRQHKKRRKTYTQLPMTTAQRMPII